MNRRLQRFERTDPFPHIPFAVNDFDELPSLAEVIGWIVLAAAFLTLCYGFLIADVPVVSVPK